MLQVMSSSWRPYLRFWLLTSRWWINLTWQDTTDFHFNLQKSDTAAPRMLWFQAAFSHQRFTWNLHLELGKPYKQKGRINKILIKISLPCHPSIRLWLEFSGKKLNSADVHALAASPLSFHKVNTLSSTPSPPLKASQSSPSPGSPSSVAAAHLHTIYRDVKSAFST